MANPMKGEATVRVAAGEFTLAYTLGACIAIEGQFGGTSFNQILKDMEAKQDLKIMLAVVWGGLLKHHKMSIEEAGDLINMTEATAWGEAIGRALGGAEADADPGGRANPRKAKTGTG